MATVRVQEVAKGQPFRQFLDLPLAVGGLPLGSDWMLASQRRRLRPGCPPEPGATATLLLAWRGGRPVGRMTAHIAEEGTEARFGFLVVEGPDEADEVVAALLAAAARWAGGQDRTSLVGPLSWGPEDGAGVLVAGHDAPLVTGRAWNPPWYAELLAGVPGLAHFDELNSYRLPAGGESAGDISTPSPEADAGGLAPGADLAVPAELGPYADPSLLLARSDGTGGVVAVPDVTGAMATWKGGRSVARGAWSLARRARKRTWEGCVVLAMDGPEDVLIPAVCAAAGRAGYRWVLSPWAPPGHQPVMVHRLYRGAVNDLRTPSA